MNEEEFFFKLSECEVFAVKKWGNKQTKKLNIFK